MLPRRPSISVKPRAAPMKPVSSGRTVSRKNSNRITNGNDDEQLIYPSFLNSAHNAVVSKNNLPSSPKGSNMLNEIDDDNHVHEEDQCEFSDDEESNVFITDIRQKNDKDSHLRAPSPFEEEEFNDTHSLPIISDYVGEEVHDKFWKKFRSLDSDTRSRIPRPNSARTKYLNQLKEKHLSPEPMGIVRKQNPASIDLHSYRMGNDFAEAFAESFHLVPGVEVLNLSNNRINDKTAAIMIDKIILQNQLVHMDLSSNVIGIQTMKAMQRLVGQTKTIVYINIGQNNLNSKSINLICEALKQNQTVTRLNLSENNFDTEGMISISKLLEENSTIEELYLSWNKIRGTGGLRIAEAIGYHRSLRVLDLSWNSLNSCSKRSIVQALGESLANNKVLAHLDLSNNQLDYEDCKLLAKPLESNHTLIGLHMSGNQAVLNSKGFLISTEEKQQDQIHVQHKHWSIMQFELNEDGSPDHLWAYVERNCWYCGLWSEHRFLWTPPANLNITENCKVQVHISIDDWVGDEMLKKDDGGGYVLYRMLPPGRNQYFITVTSAADKSSTPVPDDTPSTTLDEGSTLRAVSPNGHGGISGNSTPDSSARSLTNQNISAREERKNNNNVRYFILKDKKQSRILRKPGDQSKFGPLLRANYIEMAEFRGKHPCNATVPRPNGISRPTVWDIKKSVFASRSKEAHSRSFWDTDAVTQKAFAADWKQCKIDRIVKNSESRADLERTCQLHYRKIHNIYRYYCARSALITVSSMKKSVDIHSVSWNGFVEFLQDTNCLEDSTERCNLADMENLFVAANLEVTAEAKEMDNPDRSLTRFEFLECTCRIAINKYLKSGIVDSPSSAFEMLFEENLSLLEVDDSDNFRKEYLYKEEVSMIFSENAIVMQELYQENVGKFCKPGEKKGMTITEAVNVLEKNHVFDETFKPYAVTYLYLCSKMMVVDEMTTYSHKKLYYSEFLEFFLRVALLKYGPMFTKDIGSKDPSASTSTTSPMPSNGTQNGAQNGTHNGPVEAVSAVSPTGNRPTFSPNLPSSETKNSKLSDAAGFSSMKSQTLTANGAPLPLEVACKALNKMFAAHLCKQEAIVAAFRLGADKAVALSQLGSIINRASSPSAEGSGTGIVPATTAPNPPGIASLIAPNRAKVQTPSTNVSTRKPSTATITSAASASARARALGAIGAVVKEEEPRASENTE